MTIASLYPSIRPSLLLDFSNTKQLDPRITFSRPTTATYYDGKTVVKAEENLLLQSEDIASASWGALRTTTTANTTTAPNGTVTADTLTEIAETNTHYLQQPISTTNGLAYTFSVFAKKGSGATAPNWIQLSFNNTGFTGVYANFDLQNGVVGASANCTAAISASTNGFYRISITATANSTTTSGLAFVVFTNNNDALGRLPSYAGATTADVYLWGAQLEQRSTVTAYTPTTTAPITNYIPALQTAVSNDARFDHDPVTGESKGLLIEEQRTNLLTYSEQFSSGEWVLRANRSSISANAIVAPDGTISADKLVEDTTVTSTHYTGHNFTNSAGSYSFSVYSKGTERNIMLTATTDGAYVGFSTATGAVIYSAGATGYSVDVGNGWRRYTMTHTATAVTNRYQISLVAGTSWDSSTYTGNGYSGIYIWGAQLEAGSFPTSYIPTVASQVTRSADSASMTGSNFSSWYRADEGTLYAESYSLAPAGTATILTVSDSTSNNRIQNTFGSFMFYVAAGGSQQASLNSGTDVAGTYAKYASGYKVNDFVLSRNGASVVSDTSGVVPIVSNLSIGASATGTFSYLNGTIKRIAYYPKRLSNTELQGLTS